LDQEDELLETIADVLSLAGLDTDIPMEKRPLPPAGNDDEDEDEVIGVLNPGTKKYAEVGFASFSSPGDMWLQVTYWTSVTEDPDGMNTAAAVVRLLSGDRDNHHGEYPPK
jgi:hypothetical protein